MQQQHQQSSAPNPRRRTSRTHCLLAPRPYEEIYHEQAYLSAHLQQKMQRVEGLIREYSAAQAQLSLGAEGKTRRRLRKLLNLLRCKLEEASEQERAIFGRLGELYMEQSSRDTWERARAAATAPVVLVAPSTPTPENDDDNVSVQKPEIEEEEEGEGTAAPVTPCPSFTLSECSVASSPVPVPPVYTADPGRAGYQAVARCVTADYLESMPEENMEDTAAAKTPTAPQHAAKEDDELRLCTRQSSSSMPEVGSLEHYYVQREAMSQDHGSGNDGEEGCASSGDEGGGRTAVKLRSCRHSMPVMQFTWPEV
ncbi:hypothetical protein ISF_06846 [Cordyceps fumosorosea ARSEF 2679]|uniref:Uncharacterized protein n=1 Tax=Cordyceps fumosorosea (strain ARSEF 2679) TaxID=1081104 RepID=A0A167R668_CORFA|nr:hypothetical protein ISF_06846 [Cordyceps fumosorosea ARSEF 2679]OAA58307.1 hypothetical protein ISF_06846 [Cordyceps fumosorosea ARSEF 2679]